MFDAVRKFQTPAKILLGLVALSLMVFAAHSYDGMRVPFIAKIGDQKITSHELKAELDRLQQPDTEEARKQVFASLINQAYLNAGIQEMGLAISIEQIRNLIIAEPVFQENGKFSKEKFEAFLKGQGLNEETFISKLQKQFAVQSLFQTVQSGSIVSDWQIEQAIALFASTHNVRTSAFNPEHYAEQVKVTDAALKKYYQAHQAEYIIPAAVQLEYLELSVDKLAQEQKVSDEEAKQLFKENEAQFAKPERNVAHILLGFPAGADEKAKEQVKKEAEKVLAEAKAHPDQFAELAKKYSQDPGSAQKGGELGFFGQDGSMVKPFESAAFSLKQGEISNLVETQYGYHIIKVLAIKEKPTFDQVKDEVVAQLKKDKAAKIFNQRVDKFSDSVYRHSKELNTSAKEFGLQVQNMDWISKEGAEKAGLPEKLIEAIFSDDVVKEKINSEPVDVGNQTFIVVRAKDTRAERKVPFDEAKEAVTKAYIHQEAMKLALNDAKAKLAKLKKGEKVEGLVWDEKAIAMNTQMATTVLSSEAHREMIGMKVSKEKPGYLLAEREGMPVLLIRVESVELPEKNPELNKQVAGQLQQIQLGTALDSYLQILKQKFKLVKGSQKLQDSAN